jgi:hypothetical protein
LTWSSAYDGAASPTVAARANRAFLKVRDVFIWAN